MRIERRIGIVAVLVVLVIGLSLGSCAPLTEQQKADQAALQQKLNDLATQLATLRESAAGVLADVQAGKVPVDTGSKLLADINAKADVIGAGLAEGVAQIKAMTAANTPWYVYVSAALNVLLIVGGVVAGPQAAGAIAGLKAIIGIMSRAMDAAGANGEASPEIKKALLAELAGSTVTKTEMQTVHAEAKSRAI